MVCWRGRTFAEAISGRVGSADGATTRKKQGVRPDRKDNTCGWSIRVKRLTSKEGINSWVVATGRDDHHLADHNHHLDPQAATHASRNTHVPDDIKLEVRLLAQHHMKPTDVARFMNEKYSYLQLTAQDVSNITSKDGFPPDWSQAAKALNRLQQHKDLDSGWVIEVRCVKVDTSLSRSI
jgi:hypothetical protein